MEIEAKYVIPDYGAFERLLSLVEIGGYSLKEPIFRTLTDHYLDTAEGLILRGGFACRLRHEHTRRTWVGTLKGLGGAHGAVHQREELEVAVAPNAMPGQWPVSPARALALDLSRAQPLAERFVIRQQRRVREIYLAGRRVAELSLDEVEFQAADRRLESLELEIELKETGTADDLLALIGALSGYGLQPEPLSKFERGLALQATQPADRSSPPGQKQSGG